MQSGWRGAVDIQRGKNGRLRPLSKQLISNAERKVKLARVRELLNEPPDVEVEPESTDAQVSHVQPTFICRHCGAPMFIINTLVRVKLIRAPPQIRGTA